MIFILGIITGVLFSILLVSVQMVIVLSRKERQEILQKYSPIKQEAEILENSDPQDVYDKFFRE
jgi:hypothetical protein